MEVLTHVSHVNGWEPAVYMRYMCQNFHLFHVSNSSLLIFSNFSAHVSGVTDGGGGGGGLPGACRKLPGACVMNSDPARAARATVNKLLLRCLEAATSSSATRKPRHVCRRVCDVRGAHEINSPTTRNAPTGVNLDAGELFDTRLESEAEKKGFRKWCRKGLRQS